MIASPGPRDASTSLGTSVSTVSERPPMGWYQSDKGRSQAQASVILQGSQDSDGVEQPSSRVIIYRGVRGLKHRNDRLHRSATTAAVLQDRPPGKAASERQPPRQNDTDQRQSSSDQPRPVQSTSSRRSLSADRLATPRTLFETLYHDKVMSKMPTCTSSTKEQVGRYITLAGLPHSRSVNVTPVTTHGDTTAGAPVRRKSPTSLELEACCRSNIVTARTRFFEEKSRSPGTPPAARRRSRSAVARLARDDNDRHPTSSGGHAGYASTPRTACNLPTTGTIVQAETSQTASSFHDQSMPASMKVSESILPINGVDSETHELKVSKSQDAVEVALPSSTLTCNSSSATGQPPPEGRAYVKRGWLLRLSFDRSWEKCWCVLTSTTFSCSRNCKPTSSSASDVIVSLPLDSHTTVQPLQLNTDDSFAFRLVSGGRDVVLLAMTSGIRTSWIRAITSCLKQTTSPVNQLLTTTEPQTDRGQLNDVTASLKDTKSFGRRSRQGSKPSHHQDVEVLVNCDDTSSVTSTSGTSPRSMEETSSSTSPELITALHSTDLAHHKPTAMSVQSAAAVGQSRGRNSGDRRREHLFVEERTFAPRQTSTEASDPSRHRRMIDQRPPSLKTDAAAVNDDNDVVDVEDLSVVDAGQTSVDDCLVTSLRAEVEVLQRQLSETVKRIQSQQQDEKSQSSQNQFTMDAWTSPSADEAQGRSEAAEREQPEDRKERHVVAVDRATSDRLTDIQQQLMDQINKNTHLAERLNTSQADKNDLEKRLELEKAKTSELEADVAHLRAELADVGELRGVETTNRLLREDLERVESRLKTVQLDNSRLEKMCIASEVTIQDMKLELESTSSAVLQNDGNVKNLEETAKTMRTEIGDLKTSLTQAEDLAARTQTELIAVNASLQDELANAERLKRNLNDETVKCQRLEKTVVDLYAELESKSLELETAEKNSRICQTKLRVSEEDNAKLRDLLTDAVKRVKELEEQLKTEEKQSERETLERVVTGKLGMEPVDVGRRSTAAVQDAAFLSGEIPTADCTVPPSDDEKLGERYAMAVRRLQSLQRDLHRAEARHVELDDSNALLRQQLTDVESNAEQTTSQLTATVDKLTSELDAAEHSLQVLKTQSDDAEAAKNRTRELEHQLENLKADYDRQSATQEAVRQKAVAQCREEMMRLFGSSDVSTVPVNEELIRKKYAKETKQIKEMYDKGFSAMEKSHQRALMEMRRTHRQELDRVRQEMDQLLREEANATQAVLDTVRKAHEAELEKERGKFLDVIAKTYCQADMESLQRQHEEDLELIQREISQLTEKYSVKCLENAALSERLQAQMKTIHANCLQIHNLLSRNDELSTSGKYELGRIMRYVEQQCSRPSGDGNTSVDLNQLNMTLQVKQLEVQQLHEELVSVKRQLDLTTKELADSREMYDKLVKLVQDSDCVFISSPHPDTHDVSSVTKQSISAPRASLRGSVSPAADRLSSDRQCSSVDSDRRTSPLSISFSASSAAASGNSDRSTDITFDDCLKRSSWQRRKRQRARTSPDMTYVYANRIVESSAAERTSVNRRSSGSDIDCSTAF